MLLTVDIGNSSISFGIFSDLDRCRILRTFKTESDMRKTSDEYAVLLKNLFELNGIERADIKDVAVASVVPKLTKTISDAIKKLVDCSGYVVVGPGVKTGFPIRIDDPSELGADLVANAAAVINIQKSSSGKRGAVIVDMGTATTIFAINHAGEYIGGCIMPGVQISFDALHTQTAQLPGVTLELPKKAIGRNSVESVRSGVVLGNALMIDGFIESFSREMKCDVTNSVYATGGVAELIIPACSHKIIYEPHLTLKGLFYIYRNNSAENNADNNG